MSNSSPESTIEGIQRHVDQLAAQHPEHKLSFGYTGNCTFFGGKADPDYRAWQVFTPYRRVEFYGLGSSYSFHLGSTEATLKADLEKVLPKIDTFVRGLSDKLGKGAISKAF